MGGVRLVTAPVAARYLAPAAFLLAVTVLLLVVRSTLRSSSTPVATGSRHVSTKPAPRLQPLRITLQKQYYVIQSGDTLGGIASRFSTSVEALLRLNPGIQPTALRPGGHVRVK